MTGEANPNPIPLHRVDVDEFSEWAVWCDRLDSNGNKFYECDFNADAEGTVFARLMDIMSTGRGSLAMRENKYSVIYDKFPTVPAQLITPQNSWDFNGSKVWPKKIHGLRCTYIDKLSDYQSKDIIAYADGYSENNAQVFESLNMPYTTRFQQAWRDGRYFIAQGILRPETFTVSMDIENIACERGDLVRVQHDVARMGGISARIEGITGLEVQLSEIVSFDPEQDYYLRIRKSDGTQIEYSVVDFVPRYVIRT